MAILNLGTYPPRQCGIATFSMDLCSSLRLHGNEIKVMAISDEKYKYAYGNEVVFELEQHKKAEYIRAAAAINADPSIHLVVIQHEYGIYGGNEGEYLLDLVNLLYKPFILVTHTVLPNPKKQHRDVLHSLAQRAAAIVCMTGKSAELLIGLYEVPVHRIHRIAHGVPEFKKEDSSVLKKGLGYDGRQIICTFGLIGPGKGLELGIQAVSELVSDHPEIQYLILGRTHPMLLQTEGERYRSMLEGMVKDLGIESNVQFVNKYLTDEELGQYLYMTDIYLSPYPAMDQAVSGTMAFAVGCGRAIVSTPYSYAMEALADGRGLLSNSTEPVELAGQMRKILEDPVLKVRLQKKAYAIGKTWTWRSVGMQYTRMFASIQADYRDEFLEAEELNHAELQTFS